MKSWKDRWENELDKIVPELSDEVKNAPIPVNYEITDNGGNTAALARKKPLIITATAILLAMLCAIITCIYVLRPKRSDIFMFAVEINPAVCMVSDGSGKITGVMASNSDADVILAAEGVKENIIGKSADEAIVFYTDTAAKLGFIDFAGYGSAVRISAYGSGETADLLSKSDAALKNYFTGKGVYAVVLSESVSREEFSLRGGINCGQSLRETADYISAGNPLFIDRKSEGLDLSGLQNLYNDIILKDKLINMVENSLKGNLEKLRKNAEDIQRLFELYREIYGHEDNPAHLLKDYWEVKKYYGGELTGEFARLVEEMDTALLKYEEDYGVKITCYTDLFEAVKSYASLSIEQLAAFLENFTFELFEEYSAELSEILKITGIVSDKVLDLLQLPETAEEYSDKIRDALTSEYAYRLDLNEEKYNQNRAPLSIGEYDNFISVIEDKYGSLSDYWQVIKK